MTPQEQKFFAAKHEWMLSAIPNDGTVTLSDGRKLSLFLSSKEGKPQLHGTKYLVVVLPGGGYEFCSCYEDHIVGRHFARSGFDAVTINYPTCCYDDAIASGQGVAKAVMYAVGVAIKELRCRKELGFSEHKIIVCGFSAGGHLAATMSTLYASDELADLITDPITGARDTKLLRPDGAILNYPVISADPQLAHEVTFGVFTGTTDKEKWQRYSCERNVTADTPPMYIWHTATDQAVACGNSVVMAQALWQHGVPCELHIFARGMHGASLACAEIDPGVFPIVDDYLAQWLNQAITFIRTFVR